MGVRPVRAPARWTERGERLIYRGGAAFGRAIVRGVSLRDGFVQVRLRPLGGCEGRAGGVVWRWRDPDNCYVPCAHALAGNVVALPPARGLPGAEFDVSFDGRRPYGVRDDTLDAAGAVGMWSKADSVPGVRVPRRVRRRARLSA